MNNEKLFPALCLMARVISTTQQRADQVDYDSESNPRYSLMQLRFEDGDRNLKTQGFNTPAKCKKPQVLNLQTCINLFTQYSIKQCLEELIRAHPFQKCHKTNILSMRPINNNQTPVQGKKKQRKKMNITGSDQGQL